MPATIALYPGSFDPITLGHVDIIRRLSSVYGEIVVLIASSLQKEPLFTAEERLQLTKASLAEIPGVRVEIFDGLTVDYARRIGAKVIIRGLRAVADFEYEFAMANMNRKLDPQIETMIVFTRPEYSFVSSRMVKEVAFFSGNVDDLVPPVVAKAMKVKILERRKS